MKSLINKYLNGIINIQRIMKSLPLGCILVALFSSWNLSVMAASVEYSELNQAVGVEIWQDDSLWDDSIGRVAKVLECRLESDASGKVTYRGQRIEFFGIQAESILLSGNKDQLTESIITFTNKGDFRIDPPKEKDFESVSEYKKAYRAFEKAYENPAKEIDKRIRIEGDALEDALEKLFGEAEKEVSGQSSALRERVKTWEWKGHRFQLAEQKGEYLSLKILPSASKAASLPKEYTRDEFYELIQKRIVRRENGDVIISQIPMVNQGSKGYCVPATWSRYLRYMGVEGIDEHQLAKAGGTGIGGGTYTDEMVAGVKKLASRNRLRVDSLSGRFSMRQITSHIDKGLPLMWSMCCVGAFKTPTKGADRMGDMSPEEWKNSLRDRRREAKKLEDVNYDYHMCMIIGYNERTKEVATSDSWGASHAEKWYPYEEVEAVFRDSWYVIKR